MAPIRPNRRSRKKQSELVPISPPTTGNPRPIPSIFYSPISESKLFGPPKPDLPVVDPPKSDLPKPDLPKPDLQRPDPPKPDSPKPCPPKPEPPKADSAKVEAPKSNPPKANLAAKYPPHTGNAHSLYHSTTSRPLADPPKSDPPKDSSTDDPPVPDEQGVAFRKGFTYRAPDMIAMDSNGRNQLKVEFWLGTPAAHFINLDLRPGHTPGYIMNDVDLTFRMYNRTTSTSGVTTFGDRIFHSEPDTVYCLHLERGVAYSFDNIPDSSESSSCEMPVGTSLRMMKERLAFPKMDTPLYHTSTPQASSSARRCRDYITPLQSDPRGTRCTYPIKATAAVHNQKNDTPANDDKDWAASSSPIQFTPSTTASIASDDEDDDWPAGFVPERLLYHPALPGGPNELGAFIAAHNEKRIFERCNCGELIPIGEDHCSVEAGTDRLMRAVGLDIEDDYSVAKRIAMDFFVGHVEGTPIQIDEAWYKMDPREYVQARDKYAEVMRLNAQGKHMDDMEERVLRATRMELVRIGTIMKGKGRGLNEVIPGSMDFAKRDVVREAGEPVLDARRWGLDFSRWWVWEDLGGEEPFFYGTYNSDDEFMNEAWRGHAAF
ncbi:uncharacterized protein H6S33_011071 [Morchella sextelata]|uniref:uncharacterized protein n=1 Tax=Morchella sextelata TaxID=1174677 RepID=UPI001D03CBAF|nr:uncharacterized protein H6S33_011071 [Morchella sextelata]KAH0611806.1 hypothetical protein H6S33_011071 [Morchella sextelata]